MPISRRYFLRDGAQAVAAVSVLGTATLSGCTSTVSASKEQVSKGQTGKAAVRSVSASDIKVLDVAGLAMLQGAGCNVVALGNDRVLSSTAAPELNARLRALGFEVYDPDMSRLQLAGGGVHCMCQPLRRDPG